MILKSNNKLLAVFMILVIVLCSGHAFQTIYPIVPNLVFPAAGLVVLLELLKAHRMIINRSLLAVILFGAMVFCTMIVYFGGGAGVYMLLLCPIIIGYGVSRMYSFRKMVNCYLWIMTVVTMVAVVCYVLVQDTTVLKGLPAITNVNGVEYRIGGIFNYMPIVPDRNCGMFWEPGLFATHLAISMVFEIMCREKPNILRLLLFTAGILTANSSAGFVLWFLCLILLFVKKIKQSGNLFATVAGVFIILIGIMVIANFDQILQQTSLGENEYFQKLSSDSVADSSRNKAIRHNLESFLSAPIFGVGFANASNGMKYNADTSTSTYMMSIFGVLGVLYTVYWFYGIFFNVPANLFAKTLLFAIAMIIVNKEPHHQMVFSWCLMFYLIKGDLSCSEPAVEKKKRRKIVLKWGDGILGTKSVASSEYKESTQ